MSSSSLTPTFLIHEATAKLLERSSVAHGPERTVELVVGHHQVFGVSGHVDHLEMSHKCSLENCSS